MTDTLSTGHIQGWDLFRPLGADSLFARVLARQGSSAPVLLSRPSAALLREPGLETLLAGAIQIQHQLIHPSLCRPLRVEQLEGVPWLVQEGLDGLLLTELSSDPWPAYAAAEVGRQLCESLSALYTCPGPNGQPSLLIFPELKAANICISRFGDVKLLSPGFSMQGAPVALLRLVLQSSGERMAPETRRAGVSLTPSVFQYTVGALLLELLTGQRFTDLLGASSISPPDELEDAQKRLPGRLVTLRTLKNHPLRPTLEKLLGWEPQTRFVSLEAAAATLLGFAWSAPGDAGSLEPTLAPGMASTAGDFPSWLEQAFRHVSSGDQTPMETGEPMDRQTDPAAPYSGLPGLSAETPSALGAPPDTQLAYDSSASTLQREGFRFGALLEDDLPGPPLNEATTPGFPPGTGWGGSGAGGAAPFGAPPDGEGFTQTQRDSTTQQALLLEGVPEGGQGLSLPQTEGGLLPRGVNPEESTFVNDPLAAPPARVRQTRPEELGPEKTPHAGLWVSGSRGPINAEEENTPVKPITPLMATGPLGASPFGSSPHDGAGGAPAAAGMPERAGSSSGPLGGGSPPRLTQSPADGGAVVKAQVLQPGAAGPTPPPTGAAQAGASGKSGPDRRRWMILGAVGLFVVVVLLGLLSRTGSAPPAAPGTDASAGLVVGNPYEDQQLQPEKASNPALNLRTDEPSAEASPSGVAAIQAPRGGAEGATGGDGTSVSADGAATGAGTPLSEERLKALLEEDEGDGRRLSPEVMKPFRGRVRKGSGNLEIHTSPPDALVIVNGDQTFNPPFVLEEVPAGQVQLIFRSMELGMRHVSIIDLHPGETFRGTWSFREKRWVMEE